MAEPVLGRHKVEGGREAVEVVAVVAAVAEQQLVGAVPPVTDLRGGNLIKHCFRINLSGEALELTL